MPQPPTTYMGLVQPSENDDDDVWDTILTALFLLVDAHDHTTGKGAKVPTAGINIDGELEFNGKQATELGGAAFNNLGAPLSGGTYIAHVAGGNLYFRNATTNVQITSGATLNMTTVGGIAGDYTSVTAEVAFVNAQDGYTFKQQVGAAVRQYAKMDSADLRIYEFKAHPAAGVPTNFVGLASPAALAASYTLTMPAALPGSTSVALVSAAGAVTVSNTIPNALTLSALLTASAGVTCAANTDVTVSGTGRHKHGTQFRTVAAADFFGNSMSFIGGAAGGYTVSTAGTTCFIPIAFVEGETINLCTIDYYGDGAADITSFLIYQVTAAGTVSVVSDVGGGVTNPSAAWVTSSDIVTATITPPAGASLWAEVVVSATNIRLKNLRTGYSF